MPCLQKTQKAALWLLHTSFFLSGSAKATIFINYFARLRLLYLFFTV